MFGLVRRPRTMLGALLVLAGLWNAGNAGTPPKTSPRKVLIERFDNLTPAERLGLIEKHAKSATEFHTVARGDVTRAVIARGSLAPAKASDVYCTVRTTRPGSLEATTIKSIVPDGTRVKKGDVIGELDDKGVREQVKDAKVVRDEAQAQWMAAKENIANTRQLEDALILGSEITVRTTELSLKRYKGKDEAQREILELSVKQAKLHLAAAKNTAKSRIASAESMAQAKKTVLDNEEARMRDMEEQIPACRLRAPQNGIVIYYTPDTTRFSTNRNVVAKGEPVREGQKLLQISDLSQMIHVVNIPEALIAQVRLGEKAVVRVDAFPDKQWAGKVQEVATVPAQADWFNSDVKVYPVQVALAGDVAGLRPGMSAEVTIETGRAAGVLWVPVQAVLRVGTKHYCYVKSGKELRKAEVVPGLRSELRVEIKTGLQDGDQVLRDPLGLLRRLSPFLGPATGAMRANPPVQLHSVRPPEQDTGARRAWIESYGLTYRDLRAIAALPTVAQVVPIRRFPQTLGRLDRQHEATVVATTAALADVQPMPLAEGRFLSADDARERRMVVVLGAAVADALFPDSDAIGATIVLNKEAYEVVGVLQDAAGASDNSVFLPLTTCLSRFGERVIIRTKYGSRHAEQVAISDLLVVLDSPQDRRATVESIRGILDEHHNRPEWLIQADR